MLILVLIFSIKVVVTLGGVQKNFFLNTGKKSDTMRFFLDYNHHFKNYHNVILFGIKNRLKNGPQ